MLARNTIRAQLTRMRALSGTASVLGHAPPGYSNIYLPDKEMPQPLPRGGMTPALRAQLAKKIQHATGGLQAVRMELPDGRAKLR